ncbi:MAG: YggS family pyridoxal phosphate-dependent enzyme [Burkholderiales bacterium]
MTTIASNLQAVHDRIRRTAHACDRDPAQIRLLAVSKTFPASCIEEACAAGQRAFGESYVQEGVRKITQLAALGCEWHFIGPIQSNKTRLIAEHFQWVHGIDREKIAARLSDARPAHLPPLEVCIQVNVSGETSKSGVEPGGERALARAISAMPRLRLRGLMAIPEPTPDERLQCKRFALLREVKDALNAEGFGLDTLSMGMSDDMEAAIFEGATIVRVGTAIFGPRETIGSQ